MRRTALLSVLSLIVSGVFVVGSARPAYATFGESETKLAIYPNPIAYGQIVTIQSTVYDRSGTCNFGDCNSATGTVYYFFDGDPNYFFKSELHKVTDVVSQTGTYQVSVWPVGAHSIRAWYHPGPSNTGNPRPFDDSEQTVDLTITPAKVNLALARTSPNPSFYGEPVTFTATATPNPPVDTANGALLPSGTVQLTEGPTVLAQGTLDAAGQVTFQTSSLWLGDHPDLAAAYLGDPRYEPRLSNEVAHSVLTGSSILVASASPSPSNYGDEVLFSAQVSPPNATGGVSFNIDTVDVGVVPLVNGQASLTRVGLKPGIHTVSMSFPGDGNVGGSDDQITHEVFKAATEATLSVSPNPALHGQPVNMSASLTPNSATGTVTFRDGTTVLATAPVNDGVASFITASLAIGSHGIAATYSGDEIHDPVAEPGVILVVNARQTTTQLDVPLGPVSYGKAASVLVTVGPVSPGTGAPPGTVRVKEGATVLATATLTPGTNQSSRSMQITGLAPGAHTLVAEYLGAPGFTPSVSLSSNVEVLCGSGAAFSFYLNFANGDGCIATPIGTYELLRPFDFL